MTKKIGIYGGTFDPIHFGHINLALELIEKKKIDEVWFCPVWINPHKMQEKPRTFEHRKNMLQIALQNVPGCSIVYTEENRKGPSYTLDTIRDILKVADPDQQFFIILGDDAIPTFYKWHKPEEIIKLTKLCIGSRVKDIAILDELKGYPELCDAIQKACIPTRILEISSTDIRNRLAKGLYCGHLLPEKVLDYIYKNHLY